MRSAQLKREVIKLEAERDILKKPRPTSRRNRREVLLHREATEGIWSADWMCGALGVSRGGFYAWLKRPPGERSRTDEVLSAKVRSSFFVSDRTYGARRVWHDLLADGVDCRLHQIGRLMRQHGLIKHARAGVGFRPTWVSGRPPLWTAALK